MLTNRDKLELHTIRGTAIQCGRQYGQRWSTGMLGFYYQELRPDKQKLAYARRCWEHVEKACPHSAQFMRGMARGSGLTVDQVALLALHEENHHIRPHCTAFAATGAATRGGKTLVAMNWDWSAQLYPWAGLLRLDARGSPRALTYHYPGLWASRRGQPARVVLHVDGGRPHAGPRTRGGPTDLRPHRRDSAAPECTCGAALARFDNARGQFHLLHRRR